jgi:hypothetical protein
MCVYVYICIYIYIYMYVCICQVTFNAMLLKGSVYSFTIYIPRALWKTICVLGYCICIHTCMHTYMHICIHRSFPQSICVLGYCIYMHTYIHTQVLFPVNMRARLLYFPSHTFGLLVFMHRVVTLCGHVVLACTVWVGCRGPYVVD